MGGVWTGAEEGLLRVGAPRWRARRRSRRPRRRRSGGGGRNEARSGAGGGGRPSGRRGQRRRTRPWRCTPPPQRRRVSPAAWRGGGPPAKPSYSGGAGVTRGCSLDPRFTRRVGGWMVEPGEGRPAPEWEEEVTAD